MLCENNEPEPVMSFGLQDKDGPVLHYSDARIVMDTWGPADGKFVGSIAVTQYSKKWVRGDASAVAEAKIAELQERNDWQAGKIERLIAEIDAARTENAFAISEYNALARRVTAERDEARSQFLQATESGKWAYTIDLEARLEAASAHLKEAPLTFGSVVAAIKILDGEA